MSENALLMALGLLYHIWKCDHLPNSCQDSQSNPFWVCGLMGRMTLSLHSPTARQSFHCTGNHGLLHHGPVLHQTSASRSNTDHTMECVGPQN